MNKNLNETTNVEIEKYNAKSRNIFEKEKEIIHQENILNNIRIQLVNNKMNKISYILSIIILFIVILITYNVDIFNGYSFKFIDEFFKALFKTTNIIAITMEFPCILGLKRTNKQTKRILKELKQNEIKLNELNLELNNLKSQPKLENIDLDKLNSKDSPSIIYPKDNKQNIDTLTNTGKVKSLKKEF